MSNLIHDIIKPETDLERQIVNDAMFIAGCMWGKPRSGHPEGEVIYHIGEVLANVDKYGGEDREVLRLITIIHDTFKYNVDPSKPRTGENHHAMHARRFAEWYILDVGILDVIELHDEAYNAWCKIRRAGDEDKARARAIKLFYRLGENVDLYTKFYRCDTETGDKQSNSYEWWVELAKELKGEEL